MKYIYYLGTINKEDGVIGIDLFLKVENNDYKPLLITDGIYENRNMIVERFFDILKNHKIEYRIIQDNYIFNGRSNITSFESDDLITKDHFDDNKI